MRSQGKPVVDQYQQEESKQQLITDPLKANQAFQAMVGPDRYQTSQGAAAADQPSQPPPKHMVSPRALRWPFWSHRLV